MVYGVVMYDFAAERPDELEAQQGEAIIVIAQSNPEWFVAKPIGRLGGPGLIPVSFIEIRDMVTGKAVPNPQEAVQRAGVPRVEEWKKMAADYKNSSITLGRFEGSPNQQQTVEQGIDRMSLQQRQSQNQTNGHHVGEPFLLCYMKLTVNISSYGNRSRAGAFKHNPSSERTPLNNTPDSTHPYRRISPVIVLRRTSTGS
jgi:SH3 domain